MAEEKTDKTEAKPSDSKQKEQSRMPQGGIRVGAEAWPAEVLQLIGRSGIKGVMQVRCKVLTGRDEGKALIRNVFGPVRVGDILMLRETEMEAAGAMEPR